MIGTLLAILFALKAIGALHCGWLPLIIAGVCCQLPPIKIGGL